MPRYGDLLEDMDDEDESEHGRALVTTAAGWRTEMAKWIGEQRLEDANDSDSDDEDPPAAVPNRIPTAERSATWKNCTLRTLFDGAAPMPKPPREARETAFEAEAALMEALADHEEDEYPDDGAMEGSGDDYA